MRIFLFGVLKGYYPLNSLFVVFLQEKKSGIPSLRTRDSLALAVIACGLIVFKPNNIAEAYSDLLSGTAYQYHLEMETRYRLLEDCSENDCIVPALNHKPVTILSSDLSADPSRELYY